MFLKKLVKKLFKRGDKKKKPSYSISAQQNVIEYVKSDDFEIFTYEEMNPSALIDDYINTPSNRTVSINNLDHCKFAYVRRLYSTRQNQIQRVTGRF